VPEITLFHNPACSTSTKALAQLEELGADVEVVRYLKAPPDRATLEAIVAKLEDPVADLVRHDSHFASLGLDPAAYTEAGPVVELLLEHPRLLQRPLLVRGDRAIIGRPLERVAPFVAG
jgi:arsenate reductase (glutaredoxin)